MSKNIYYIVEESKKLCETDAKGIENLICKDIISQCEGFYNVFKQLENITSFTCDLKETGWDEWLENAKLFNPCVVNGSFACEMALKYLIVRRKCEFNKTHKLYELFQDLPTKDKETLEKQLNSFSSYFITDLNSEIKALSNNFIDFRYTFSFKNLSISIFFKSFVETICDYAITESKHNEEEVMKLEV